MSKQAKQLTALLLILAVLLGVYAGLRVWNSGSAARTDAAKQRAMQLTNATRISFTNENGTFSFTKTGDSWAYDSDADFPLGQNYLTALAATVSDLAAVRSFAPAGDLSQYGLASPGRTVTAQNDTESVTLLIGSAAGDNYYAMRQGDESTIYTISSSLLSQTGYQLYDMIQRPSFPTMAESNIASIRLDKADGALALAKQTESDSAEAASGTADSAGSQSNSGSTAAVSSDSSTKTSYIWSVNGTAVPEGNLTLTEYLSKLGALSTAGCYDYKPTADTLAGCGLTSPVMLTVTLDDGTQTTLSFGGTAADGTCYVQTSGSGAVWLMNGDSASVLASLSETNLLIVPQN